MQMVPELSEDESILMLDAYKGLSQQPSEDVRQVHICIRRHAFVWFRTRRLLPPLGLVYSSDSCPTFSMG